MDPLRRCALSRLCLGATLACLAHATGGRAADGDTQRQIRQLQEQNETFQLQLRKQQGLIEQLSRQLAGLQGASEAAPSTAAAEATTRASQAFSPGKVRLSGEFALGLFHSQSAGQFPNAEFRVDEAKIFVEAPIWGEVYFFTELNLFTREEAAGELRVGELYVDVENLSRRWNKESQLNLRVGRMDIPFGEEYLARDGIDNPLISHSLMDFWGVDEGVELYGSLGKVSYVVAVQNGSHATMRDYNSDKSIAARLGADPAPWLHLSVSAMRTGDLDVQRDGFSELWLGSGLVRSLGGPGATVFSANLLQGDVQLKLPRTTVKAWGGVLSYDDNDPAANNRREVYHYAIEAQQRLVGGLYAAARWSQAFAGDGFPLIGNGDVDDYGFSAELTKDLWQLSLGLGYRWNKNLVVKGEYAFEHGRTLGGQRTREDLVAGVLAGAF